MPARAIDQGQLARAKDLILLSCGLSLERGREAALREALGERMAALGLDAFEAYFETLLRGQGEFGLLVERLTVNETYFLREPAHLDLVVQHLVPELLAAREGPVRLLCAGCSTGEEPYSLAILLRERHADACERLFSIAAVDIDGTAIATARRGVFGRHSFRGMDPALVARHFTPCGPGEFSLHEPARRLVTFEQMNLLAPVFPPLMQRQDLILYRNVSIYFPRAVQVRVFRALAELLNEGGYLIVGAAETLPHDLGVLPLVGRQGLFVFRKQGRAVTERRAAPRPAFRPAPMAPPPQERRSVPRPAVPDPDPIRAGLLSAALKQAQADRGEEALLTLDRLLGQDAVFPRAHCLKACILMHGGRPEEARQASERALALDAMCLEACLILGVIARNEGDEKLAHQRFREAMYLDPDCWLAHYSLAEIHFLKGEGNRARAGYETALRILKDPRPRRGRLSWFPLVYKAEPFIHICHHKLLQLKGKV
jgi:chemotaxis protein methyltransferase CheR